MSPLTKDTDFSKSGKGACLPYMVPKSNLQGPPEALLLKPRAPLAALLLGQLYLKKGALTTSLPVVHALGRTGSVQVSM